MSASVQVDVSSGRQEPVLGVGWAAVGRCVAECVPKIQYRFKY